jgi:hypothetical protein
MSRDTLQRGQPAEESTFIMREQNLSHTQGYRMTEQEQAATFLQLRKEYKEISDECKGLREALLQQAGKYTSLAYDIRERMDSTSVDEETLHHDAKQLCDRLKRHQHLLGERSDLKVRLDSYGETFAPLEP